MIIVNDILFLDIAKTENNILFLSKIAKRKWVHVALYEIFNNRTIRKVHVTI